MVLLQYFPQRSQLFVLGLGRLDPPGSVFQKLAMAKTGTELSCTCLWLNLSWGIRNYGWTRAPINTSCWDGWNLALIHITLLSTDGWYGTSRIFKVIPRGNKDIVTPIRYYSPAERLRLIARYTSHLMKVRLGSIGVIAEPNVEVSKADASSIASSSCETRRSNWFQKQR